MIADTSGTTPPSSGGVAAPADGSAVAPIMTAIFAPLAPPQTGTPLVQSATAAAVMDCEPLHAALPRLESIAATCDATAQLLKTSLRSTSSTLRAVDLWFDEIGANGDGASCASFHHRGRILDRLEESGGRDLRLIGSPCAKIGGPSQYG